MKGGKRMLLDNIKSLSKSKKIPIYKIEKQADIARGSISKWKTVKPSAEKVAKVASCLGTTVEELLK